MALDRASIRNRLLAKLPADAFDLLHGDLTYVPLSHGQYIEHANHRIDHVYFLEEGLASIIATSRAGDRIEVGLIGPEGMSGIALVYGGDRAPHETLVQIKGAAMRLAAEDLRRLIEAGGPLRQLLLQYAYAQAVQHAHTALANGRYGLTARLARWLLMCHDRIEGDDIAMTHEFMALMLGVRRAGVTVALHELEGDKMIRTARGRIRIIDRPGLEACAGGSYGAPEAEYARVMGAPLRSNRSWTAMPSEALRSLG